MTSPTIDSVVESPQLRDIRGDLLSKKRGFCLIVAIEENALIAVG